jgi:hypothetical protein
MGITVETRRLGCARRCAETLFVWLAVLACAISSAPSVKAAERYDPFEARPRFHDPFEAKLRPVAKRKQPDKKGSVRDPFDNVQSDASTRAPLATLYEPRKRDAEILQAKLQTLATGAPEPNGSPSRAAPENASEPMKQLSKSNQPDASSKACAAAAERPLAELGIGIEPPTGQLPTNRAAACWQSINSNAGPLTGARSWACFNYQWDATSVCHRPLYFEEINLERYGYGCGWCLQPGASAAHFFGTVPALPYLMTADCPHGRIYTLGHYRPGSCPPWRHHWPPCDPLAAAAQGGVLTGVLFLIP